MIGRAACLWIGAMVAASGAKGLAADLPPELVMPEIAPASVGQGWYIRGDLGLAARMGSGKPRWQVLSPDGTVASAQTFDSARFSRPVSYGAGVGYQFSDVLRADITADIFDGELSGRLQSAGRCSSLEAAGTSCGFDQQARYRGIGVLANGYVDLATIAGFTPYVGAGAGLTNIRWGSTRSTPFCIDGAAGCSGAAYASDSFSGAQSWRFTYALMAGVSYNISDQVKFDLGYRYSAVGDGDMFRSGAAGIGETSGRDDGLSRHEVRAGLRISF